MTTTNASCEVIEKWGPQPPRTPDNEGHPFANNLYRSVTRLTSTHSEDQLLRAIVARFNPRPSLEKPEMLSIWPDRAAYDVGKAKRLRGKPGRMIMRMFPWLSGPQLEEIVDKYRETYGSEATTYELKTGETAENFKHAYSHDRATMSNPNTTYYRKSIADSCMRYNFDHMDTHPAEVYASGDFEMIWVENGSGLIAGRCVVRKDPCIAGPIYGVSEKAMDMIDAHLRSIGAVMGSDADDGWVGAKLVAIESNGGYVGPYLDLEPRSLSCEGDYLVVSSDGSVNGADYQGILSRSDYTCDYCGNGMSEDEVHLHRDETLCEHCFGNNFFHCDYYEDYYPDDEHNEVMVITRWLPEGGIQHWSDDAVEHHAVEVLDGQLWATDDTYLTADGEHISPKHYEADYFTSEWDGEIYHNDDLAITTDGECISMSEAKAEGYIANSDNEWELPNEQAA